MPTATRCSASTASRGGSHSSLIDFTSGGIPGILLWLALSAALDPAGLVAFIQRSDSAGIVLSLFVAGTLLRMLIDSNLRDHGPSKPCSCTPAGHLALPARPTPIANMTTRILIINVCRIGDTPLGTPLITALRAHFGPELELTCLAHPERVELLQGLPQIDHRAASTSAAPCCADGWEANATITHWCTATTGHCCATRCGWPNG